MARETTVVLFVDFQCVSTALMQLKDALTSALSCPLSACAGKKKKKTRLRCEPTAVNINMKTDEQVQDENVVRLHFLAVDES